MSARIRRIAVSETAENSLADQKMSDVQLGNAGDGSDGADRFIGQTVSGMAFEPDRFGVGGGESYALQFLLTRLPFPFAVGAGVQLDHWRAQGSGGVKLLWIGP